MEWGAGKVNALSAIVELCRWHGDGGLSGCGRGDADDAGGDAARDSWDVAHDDAADASDAHDASVGPESSDPAVDVDDASEALDAVAERDSEPKEEGLSEDAGSARDDRSARDDANSPCPGDAQASTDSEPARDGGCGCKAAGKLSAGSWALHFLIGLVWLVRRRLRPRAPCTLQGDPVDPLKVTVAALLRDA